MVMSYASRHNITGTQLDDLLKFINTLFGKDVLPRSKYMFNKIFKNNSDMVEFHFYCKTCKMYIGTQEDIRDKNIAQCVICNTAVETNSSNSGSFFINIPIAPQIQTLLQNYTKGHNVIMSCLTYMTVKCTKIYIHYTHQLNQHQDSINQHRPALFPCWSMLV